VAYGKPSRVDEKYNDDVRYDKTGRRMTSISLVLGSGGARGYAHIGAIEELLAQGYDIRSVSGCSMGALIGGIYAAGKLDVYRDWVKVLQRFDVLRLLDWTFRGGLIKGDRITAKLRDLIGDVNIEDLPISYTAVAVDLMAQREVWFSRGPLFDAIRASIAIPAVLRPHHYQGRTLVDGGLLNPVPITPTLRDLTDYTIAIDVNAPVESHGGDGAVDADPGHASSDSTFGSLAAPSPDGSPPVLETPGDHAMMTQVPVESTLFNSYRQKVGEFLESFMSKKDAPPPAVTDPGILELFARSLDVVQETVTRFKLAAQPPDLVIPIPRNACAFYEFHRAEELIELGRERTRAALRDFHPQR
jgi:NTE family protein